MPFVATCAQYREEVLEADLIGDDEECLLRDHLLAVHPNTIQPEALGVLLRQFVVTERLGVSKDWLYRNSGRGD